MQGTQSATTRTLKLRSTGGALHVVGLIAMVMSMFSSLFATDLSATTAISDAQASLLAQQQPLDRDIASFDRVVATGDFQTQLTCNDWDANCTQTELQDNGGFWTGAYAVTPGTYSFELIGVDANNAQYSLQTGQVQVADNQTGFYFEYNAATRQTNAWAVTRVASVTGPFGTVALAQDGDGFIASSINVNNDGPVDVQVQLDTGTVPVNVSLSRGSNRVSFDANGNVTNVQSLGFASVTVERTDADGNPLTGSCYLLDGTSQSRGCDSDDGNADGTTTLSFPAGFQPGSYTLRETTPADGQEAAPDQQVDLQTGESTIQVQNSPVMQTGPTAVTGNVVVLRQDQNGNAVGGSCFDIVDSSGTTVGGACDEDGDVADDGRIGILDIPAGDYALKETRTPDGYEPAADTPVTVVADQSVDAPVQSAATAAPTGDVVVVLTDENGNPVGGACFDLVDSSGATIGSACDEDGDVPNDGRTGILGVPAGDYTLKQSRTPDGFDPVADTAVTVTADQAVTIPMQAASIAPTAVPTGDIVIYRTDDARNPVGGACYAALAADGSTLGQQCDEDGIAADDGTTGISGVPAGTVTIHETRTPDGYQPAPDQQMTVEPGVQTEITMSAAAIPVEPTPTLTEEPTPTPTEVAMGDIVIYRTDEAGNQVGGSCFAALAEDGSTLGQQCDEDGIAADDGTTGIFDVPAGTVTIRETRTPDGYQPAPDQQMTVQPGVQTEITVSAPAIPVEPTVAPTEEPTVAPTEEPTAAPTEEPTVAPTEEPTVAPTEAPTTGRIVIHLTDGSGNAVGGACFAALAGDGSSLGEQCDEDGVRADDGYTGIDDVPAVVVTIHQTRVPDGFEAAPDRQMTIVAGEQQRINLVSPPIVVEPTVEPTTEPTAEPTVEPTTEPTTAPSDNATLIVQVPVSDSGTAVCFEITTGAAIAPLDAPFACDNAENDTDPTAGVIQLDKLNPGDIFVDVYQGPDDLVQADPQAVTLTAGQTTTLDLRPATPETTTATVLTSDGANPVGGACYSVDGGDATCDDGSGTLVLQGLTPGDHTIAMASAPDGYLVVDAQTVTVAADGSTTVTFTLVVATVDVTVITTDDVTGDLLPGACYAVDGGGAICDETSSGQVVIPGIGPTEESLVMTTAPEGYQPAADLTISSADVQITVPLAEETGTLNVAIVDDTGAALGGACISVDSGDQVCDDDGDGAFSFEGVSLGEHSVAVISAPAGFDVPTDPSTIVVSVTEPANLSIALTPTAPTTGNLDITVVYSDDAAVENACVTITMGDTQVDVCDGADADTNDSAGVIGFADLEPGSYQVGLSEGFTPARPSDVTVPTNATVEAGATATATLTVPLLPETGSLQLVTTAGGSNVGGACFTVGSLTVCDNDGSDADGTVGVVQINDLEPGDVQVSMSTVPTGYQTPANQSATIVAGETARLDFALTAVPQPASLTVTTVDENGDPLGNACYQLVRHGATVQTLCDASDSTPNDGTVVFPDLTAGTYQVVQTQAPSREFQTAPTQTVTIGAGEDATLQIEMSKRPGRLTVVTVDADEPTLLLQNACYTLTGDNTFGPFCDADDGTVDGRVVFTNLPAGTYQLSQTVATAGYDVAANRNVTITAGGALQITVQNEKVAPPAESGTLVVIPLDPNGNPVAGGCYQVFDGSTPVSQRLCDNADTTDARITFTELPVGEFTLRESLAPSPDWQVAADISVTIRNGETTTVEVPHAFKNGNVVIQAVNTVGLPLQNACFTLTNAGDIEICTDSTGQATVSALTPGTRQLTQTKAPFGFKLNTTPRDVVVRPGQTTTVRVVFENQPPPNTGTLQVQKFVCPAGEAGERTTFLGGAQGNAELKQTAGCVPGVATFTFKAEDGSTGSNATFTTNTDGRAQLTAEAGIYLLTETDPDLQGNSAARVRIGVGQMTTVIVINYVAPPAPKPVTINVEGYTCPAGFAGSSFADFQASCMATSQLTNQITVRAEGVNRYKQVTGDGGQVGKTAFTNLPADTYTIWAERAYSMPLNYLFCGPDPNAPTLKAVNGTVRTTQAEGSIITCRVFQVPSLYDATHGAIQVQKFNCPIDERIRGYDYKNECSRATEPIPFEIQMLDVKTGNPTGNPVRISTNGDGVIQFPMLAAGTYKLTEVENEWCFAQSNSVDSAGNVIVKANSLSEVWVYNCVGTKSPPNTGSGDAANLLIPVGTPSGAMQVLPNLMWPTVLLGIWLMRRNRHQA